MLKKYLLAASLAAAALVVPQSTATPVSAASQLTVWKATGLRQTSNSYWQPTLNQPNDYTSPANYADGRAYIKIEVTSKPSSLRVRPNICFWRHTEAQKFKYETCARSKGTDFTDEGTYYFDLKSPTSWYKKNGVFDWSVPPTLGRIMIKDHVSSKLLLDSRCGAACYGGDDLADHVPITMNSELVFVAAGQQLSPPSSWRSDCPTDWASACRGDDSTTPTTTPTTTAPPTTTPPTTTPTTTPPTTTPATTTTTTVDPGPAEITVTAGTESLLVAHRIPAATKYQVRYRAAGAKRVWTPPTALTQQRIDGLSPGVPVTVEVRGLIRGVWRSWTALTGTPTGGQTTTTTTPTTTTTTPSTGGPTGTVTTSATRYGPALTLDPGNLKIDATWSHPTATKYQLNYRPVGGDWVRSPPTTDVSAALSGLSNGTVYEVRVRAYVSKVWRPWTKLATTVGT